MCHFASSTILAGTIFCAVLCVSPAAALGLGAAAAWGCSAQSGPGFARLRQLLLQAGVVGLGLAVDLGELASVGAHGLLVAAGGIALTLVSARWLARRLGVDPVAGLLIGCGTAICGGSAIAAVSAAVRARHDAIGTALAVVFLWNAVALLVFPWCGTRLELDPDAFGRWAGLAIHDVSSVVGAAMAYSEDALPTATTTKLSRTLWILPLTLVAAGIVRRRSPDAKQSRVAVPWFIVLFVLASAVRTANPELAAIDGDIIAAAKAVLTGALFLVGAGLDRRCLRQMGFRPLLLGAALWLVVGVSSLLV